MEQHRNSGSSLLSSIMQASSGSVASPKALAAERAAASLRHGPQQPRGGSGYGRAMRRARKADRTKKIQKINKGKADLQRKREQLLDTAAQFARIWFAGPPAGQKGTGKSAFHRVAERVEKQARNLEASGKAKDWDDAIAQIEESMHETLRQFDVLQAQKITNDLAAG